MEEILENYPPGLANDPSAPYNTPDYDPVLEDDEVEELLDIDEE